MQSIIEQGRQALQHGHCARVRDLARDALAVTEAPEASLPLCELLGQAQGGLHDDAAAARTWQHASEAATTHAEHTRVFELAARAAQHQRDYGALLRLVQAQLPRAQNAQERAACLLAGGEALFQLQQYREARHRYLEPAVRLVGVAPATRVGLWHTLGCCYLAEHAFAAAQEAFRWSAGLILGMGVDQHPSRSSGPHVQWHDLRNTAHFYDGVIHLISHQPQQAIQALQAVQPPLPEQGALNTALFLALAYRQLQQPEAAERAAHPLVRAAVLPDTLRGPAAVVCAGIATLRQATAAVGMHLEAALNASLAPRNSWEPCWRARLYQELGLTLWHLGYRQGAIACYEDGLKVVLHQAGIWDDARHSDWLRGPSLLTALDNLPVHTWSAARQGELLRMLHGLAWLYGPAPDGTLAEAALALALRLATTPEQQAHLWLHAGWLAASRPRPQAAGGSHATAELLQGLQRARAHCTQAPLAPVLHGVEALLQGDDAVAQTCFTQLPAVPDVPIVQALWVAMWLWAHARQGTLEHTLRHARTPPWQTEATLIAALELLLAWTTSRATPVTAAVVSWLAPLLAQPAPHTLAALRRLCRPGALPEQHQTALTTALAAMLTYPDHAALAAQLGALLGGDALRDQIALLLERLAHAEAPTAMPSCRSLSRRHPHRPQRPAAVPHDGTTDAARALQLIALLHQAACPAGAPPLPEVIRDWLLCYPHLGTRAPEVVGALLSVLRRCPTAHAAIQVILERVSLSRRQRQALEAVLQQPPPAVTPPHDPLAWESMRSWPLAHLLETLAEPQSLPPAPADAAATARIGFALALVLARVGLLARAVECVHACLRVHPAQPVARLTLAHLLCLQHHDAAAWQHAQQAWDSLLAQVPQPQMLHLEILNHLLAILVTMRQYDRLPAWIATFERLHATLETTALNDTQQQRLQKEEGAFALARACALDTVPARSPTPESLAQQLAWFAQAIAKGTRSVQHIALRRQAEALTHLQRLDDAAATYTRIVQQWPEDRRARLGLALLTARRQATGDMAVADQAVTEALALVFAGRRDAPTPLTPQTALDWLRQAPPQHPCAADVTDVLTIAGGIAVQRREWEQALAMLLPVYARVAQPSQAYYLAQVYYARSQHAATAADQLQACDSALQYARHTLDSPLHRQHTRVLLAKIEATQARLQAARRREVVMTHYRTHICGLFTRAGVPCEAVEVDQAPEAPWLALDERVDLDEATGSPVVTVRLEFNNNARSPVSQPSVPDVALYVQHQQAAQRLLAAHGITALPWPSLAYAGSTAFASLFPERLAFNRDLVFLAYAERHALLRYARVLRQTVQRLAMLPTTTPPPSVARLVAAARYVVVLQWLDQCLGTLAAAPASKTLRRQIATLRTALPPSLLEQLQRLPAFADAYAYFHAIGEVLRPLLETRAAGLSPQLETGDALPRPGQSRPRKGRTTREATRQHAGAP